MVVDLYDYLDESCRAIASQLRFRVTPSGGLVTRHLSVGTQPRILQPQVFHIEIVDGEQSQTFDRMWIVVNNPSDDSSFGSWYSVNSTNLAWVATLPRPYASLTYTTNFAGVISASIPAPTSPNRWDNPDPTDGNLLHHAAKFSMRSVTVPGGHTNQACYDEYGQLIRSGISGGTADFAAGNFWHVRSHVREDVYPFLHAVRLDGNPGEKTPMNNITRPCLYEGEYIDKYIECRPIVQP